MGNEKRKFLRFDCLLPAELIKLEGKNDLIERATVHDFSREGLKLTINFNINSGTVMELKLFLPEKKIHTTMTGEITWKKCVNNRMEVGLKIIDMDKKAKTEILNWVFPKWLEKKREEEKKKA